MHLDRRSLDPTPAWRVPLVYFAFSFLWIFFSDRLLDWITEDPHTMTAIQTYKGWAFVGTSALIIYLLLIHESQVRARIAMANATLSVAREKAEAGYRLKSDFLATLSHELRTPLNSIIGFTGVLLQGLAGPLNAEQTKQLLMVNSSAKHLLALINDVLDLSKIEAGKVRLSKDRFNLAALIGEVVEASQTMARPKGIALRLEAPPEELTLVSDRRRVEQILLNLVSNGVKFTEHGSVTISWRKFTAGDVPVPWIEVRVRDTGVGIKAEHLSILFRPFVQIEGTTVRRTDGTGLGLGISKRLVEMLGGQIKVETQFGEGSTFSFTLPAGDEPVGGSLVDGV